MSASVLRASMSSARAAAPQQASLRALRASPVRLAALSTPSRRCVHRRGCVCAAAAEASAENDMMTMKPLGDRLLIQPESVNPVTSGGVILPTDIAGAMEDDSKMGVVVAIGEDVDLEVEAGQTVIFDSKSQVTEVPVGENSVMFVAQASIQAVLS